MRRALRILSSVLIVAGALLLLDAGLTVVWQEPVSALYARAGQERLESQLSELRAQGPSALEQRALATVKDSKGRVAFFARALRHRAVEGRAVARLRADRIGLDTVVVEGTDGDTLRKGPGHYPGTPLPGAPGTVAVAGHRTTYGAPFRKLDQFRPGDPIEVEMPYGTFVYEVERARIVAPTATWVTRRVAHDRLVLTACHPLYSAEQRIVVFARLVETRPSAVALREDAS